MFLNKISNEQEDITIRHILSDMYLPKSCHVILSVTNKIGKILLQIISGYYEYWRNLERHGVHKTGPGIWQVSMNSNWNYLCFIRILQH